METKFKVGDRVRVIKNLGPVHHNNTIGKCGIITKLGGSLEKFHIHVTQDDGTTGVRFKDDELELICTQEDVDLVNKLNAPVFKVGDRVEIIGTISHPENIGKHGTVRHVYSSKCGMVTDDGGYWNCDNAHMKPLSPQQTNQTNKPKEEQDMKPYAVIVHNLGGTEGSINGRYATEAEAKETAESLVASYRASVTQRTYFTVTILNTKTGELVGSVTDAPPAVDWAKK